MFKTPLASAAMIAMVMTAPAHAIDPTIAQAAGQVLGNQVVGPLGAHRLRLEHRHASRAQ